MAKKISKRKIEDFLNFIAPYYSKNQQKLVAIAERVDDEFDEEGIPVFIASVGMVAIAMINGYKFDEETYNNFVENLYLKEYEKCIEICEYLHEYAYYALTITWDSYPKSLSRHLLISARCNVSELMYAIMAAFRCEETHLVEVNNYYNIYRPISSLSEDDILRGCEPGEFVTIAALINDYKTEVVYDFGEWWTFNIRFRKPVIIKQNYESPHVILQKANGYGIYEDNKCILELYLENPNYVFDGEMVKNTIPFDFYNSEFDELKESIEEEFKCLRSSYGCIEEDDEYVEDEFFGCEDDEFLEFLNSLCEDDVDDFDDSEFDGTFVS